MPHLSFFLRTQALLVFDVRPMHTSIVVVATALSYPWHSLGNEIPPRPNQGFTDDLDTFLDDNADATSAIEEEFPNCRVIPLSRLTMDEDGINSGDVDSFDASFYVRER